MSSTSLVIALICGEFSLWCLQTDSLTAQLVESRTEMTVAAPIISHLQQLNATVGGSILIPCTVSVKSSINLIWFYWQEYRSNNILFHWKEGNSQPVKNHYMNRCQVFNAGFSSGNISIRLDNITAGDDNKTFLAVVKFYDEQKKEQTPDPLCKSTLQVSAPYKDLILTINKAESATCRAHGGYPEPQVSWTGQNKSSAAHLDLKDAQQSLHPDPTDKTFSVMSSVSVKELQSVTCTIYNNRSNQTIKTSTEIDGLAPFQETTIEINEKEKTATCSTKGWFTTPVIEWSSADRGTRLEPDVPTLITKASDGSYNSRSTINITGLHSMICEVIPNQTVNLTEDILSPTGLPLWSIIIIISLIIIIPIIVFYCKRNQRSGNEDDREQELYELRQDDAA